VIRRTSIYTALVSLALVSTQAIAQQIDFEKQVWPILQSNCFDCHGEAIHEGNLRLDAKTLAFRGGITGIGIVSGKPDQSPLYLRLVTAAEGERMPAEREALAEDQIDVIRQWIEQGAKWPDSVGSDATEISRHWAYVSPSRPELPMVSDFQWPLNPLDYFILQKLDSKGISPSSRIDQRRLVRRVYLDLVGYPPTYEQVEHFVNDSSPDAYQKLVEGLLASPQYGVRWARPWLDLARYADSNGYQADQYRNVWPFRDWVINALNNDMPFDQFTIEQIAGDLLDEPTQSQQIATGFHRLTTLNVEGGTDPELSRLNQVIDRVNTTATVWLGSTIECSQCHNHKYDPFSQKEYYELLAYFNNTPIEVSGKSSAFNFYGPTINVNRSLKERRKYIAAEEKKQSVQKDLEKVTAQFDEGYGQWLQEMKTQSTESQEWHILRATNAVSTNGATLKILEDHSVLSTGENPDKDVYEIEFTSDLPEITGFKLEALTHDELPGKGPGRFTAERPNFVLQEFTLHHGGNVLKLSDALADFSQTNFEVSKAIDGDESTAWAIAPQFSKPHSAEFLIQEAIESDSPITLKARLVMNYGGSRVIGRVRLSAMTGQRKSNAPSKRILDLAAKLERNAKEEQELHNAFLKLQPEYVQAQKAVTDAEKALLALQAPTALVMSEMEKPRETYLLIRGEYKNNGDRVLASTPSILHAQLEEDSEQRDRLELARWLVSPENPLVARVTVNRWWAEFFGKGMVVTEEDFGSQGDLPTHPELLDWLAVEFMEQGWSMKHIHRLIVNSATYQQNSKARPDLQELDPTNRWLARMPRMRMSAEGIRDTMLQISGLLELQMGGEPIYPPQPAGIWRHVGRNAPKYNTSQQTDRYRRGVYVIWRRSAPYPAFTNFDAPDRTSCVVSRSRTNTPLQALTLLNDPMYWEMTQALGQHLHQRQRDGAVSLREMVSYAFMRTISRKPSEPEVDILSKLYIETVAQLSDRPADLMELVGQKDKSASAELGAWYYLANVLLNLDETITRN